MSRRILSLLLLFSVLGAPLVAAEAPVAPPLATAFRVLVHPSNPVASVARSFLVDAFLKRVTRWPHGEVIKPADLARTSPARRRFAEQVLGRSLPAIRSYWQQQIFSGRELPPPELDSDAAAVAFVMRHPGAVAYVSVDSEPGAAKILLVK